MCLAKQDGRSSVEGQPQQMAVCLVKQDGRSSTAMRRVFIDIITLYYQLLNTDASVRKAVV